MLNEQAHIPACNSVNTCIAEGYTTVVGLFSAMLAVECILVI